MKRDVQTGIIIIDEMTQTVFSLNHYIYQLTGFVLEEVQNKPIQEIFSEEKESLLTRDGKLVPIFFEKSRIFVHKKSYTMFIVWNEEYEIQHHPIYKTITENSFDLVQILRKDFTTTFISSSHEDVFEMPTFQLENKKFIDLVAEEDKQMVEKKLLSSSAQKRNKQLKFSLVINQHKVPVEAKISPVSFNENAPEFIVLTLRPLTLREEELENFIKTEQMFNSLFSNNPDSVFSLGMDFTFKKVNHSFLSKIASAGESVSKEQIQGIPFTSFIHPDNFIKIYRDLTQVRNGQQMDLTTKMLKNDGTTFHVKISLFPNKIKEEVVGIFGIIKDINQLMEQKEENHRLAFHDGLTGLPNRRSFQYDLVDRLKLAAENEAKQTEDHFSVFFFDLDGFKKINDNLGHKAGDDLLIAVADRVKRDLPEDCKLYRVSGDEFTIIVNRYPDKRALYRIARGILKSFSKNFLLDSQEVLMTSSVGISIYPDHSKNAEDLIKFADSAMYNSKSKGKNYFSFFKPNMTIESVDHFYINQFLPKAIEKGEFQLYFQPVVDTETGKIRFAESLIRWEHETEGFISPEAFVPLAEVSGFIFTLGDWIIEEAFRNLRNWKDEGYELSPISINISGKQFERNSVADIILKMSKKYDIDTSYIIVEITESVAMEGKTFVLDEIKKMKRIGCKISIDDFGSGYSSLVYLKKFPVDSIKMDREFVSGLVTEKVQREIVKAIVNLGHILNLNVVAEGVETVEEHQIMQELNVDFIQGYLFSKPLNETDFKNNFLKKD